MHKQTKSIHIGNEINGAETSGVKGDKGFFLSLPYQDQAS
jgi:hypothetical protein